MCPDKRCHNVLAGSEVVGRKREPPATWVRFAERAHDVGTFKEVACPSRQSAIDRHGDVRRRAAVREHPSVDLDLPAGLVACRIALHYEIDIAAQIDQEIGRSSWVPQLGDEWRVANVPSG